MTTKNDQGSIREAMRGHYAERARAGSSCCSSEPAFYQSDEIGFMPEDVASFSLGCGNAVGHAGLQPGDVVLDLGSGGGLECFIAAREVGPGGRVIGLDMTPEMLDRARAAAARMNFDIVEFREGLIEDMPVEDASVDVIISNCVINLSPDKAAVMREMARVLKPGGRIAISDVVTHAPVPAELQHDMALWSACASGALPAAEWERGLRALGFVDVRVTPLDEEDGWEEIIPESRPYSALISARKPGA